MLSLLGIGQCCRVTWRRQLWGTGARAP